MKTQSLLSILLSCLLAAVVHGRECPHCGRGTCEPVCKLVCTTRTVEKTCYGCECENVCIPSPSTKCREHSESAGKCGLLCYLRWTEWCPGCAKPASRKKLAKYVVTREVPSYKWVVVPACCCNRGPGGDYVKPAPAGAEVGNQYALTEEELRRVAKKLAQNAESRKRGSAEGFPRQ